MGLINVLGAGLILSSPKFKRISDNQKALALTAAYAVNGPAGLLAPVAVALRARDTGKGGGGATSNDVEVPDVTTSNPTVDDATATLKKLGLVSVVDDGVHYSEVQSGDVIRQHPRAGAFVSPGSTVTLFVSAGLPQTPDDLDKDIKTELDTVKTELDAVKTELDDMNTSITQTLNGITQTLATIVAQTAAPAATETPAPAPAVPPKPTGLYQEEPHDPSSRN